MRMIAFALSLAFVLVAERLPVDQIRFRAPGIQNASGPQATHPQTKSERESGRRPKRVNGFLRICSEGPTDQLIPAQTLRPAEQSTCLIVRPSPPPIWCPPACLLESGIDIPTVQGLRGHADGSNTRVDLHVMRRPGTRAPSPLDLP
jgi:hypothetical protein